MRYFHFSDGSIVKKLFWTGKSKGTFICRTSGRKGVCYAIEAMRNVENAMLVIAGDGPLREELQRQADKVMRETGKKIVFLGAKTHEELKKNLCFGRFICNAKHYGKRRRIKKASGW